MDHLVPPFEAVLAWEDTFRTAAEEAPPFVVVALAFHMESPCTAFQAGEVAFQVHPVDVPSWALKEGKVVIRIQSKKSKVGSLWHQSTYSHNMNYDVIF